MTAVGTRSAGPARTAQPDPACSGRGPTDGKCFGQASKRIAKPPSLRRTKQHADAEAPQIRLIWERSIVCQDWTQAT
jgi:hypothetical protein